MNVGSTAYMVEFLIVSTPSSYNCIMGRSALNQLQAKIAACDLFMEVFDKSNVHVMYGDHRAAQECYFTIVKEVKSKEKNEEEEAKIPKTESEGEYEFLLLIILFLIDGQDTK